ncbi:hypothetical protein AB0J13_07985 [Streptomyces anulatus]|uniref:hypothetical protein n=1 Tax=Streptomyces anulatus TaxID=1892 RepID=UPI0033FA335C
MKTSMARTATLVVTIASAALLASTPAWANGDSGEASPGSSTASQGAGDLIAQFGEVELDLAALIPEFDR